MVEINAWLLYAFLIVIGFFAGFLLSYRSFATKVEDVLNDLKSLGELSQERYDYFMKRYVINQNKFRGIGSVFKKMNERRKKKNV